MKKIFCLLTFTIFSLIATSSAFALLGEVRLNYGDTSGSPTKYNDAYFKLNDGPEIKQQTYTGVDAILMLPVVPLGFGIRYESTSKSETQFNEQIDYAIKRTALLINYRIINSKFYLGPIVSYGLSQSLSFKLPLDPDEFKSSKSSSYSYGLEGGVKFGFFRIGAEAGVTSLVFEDLKNKNNVIPNKNGLNISELDFGGNYYRLHLGIGF